jgi:hypothetical protein
MKVFRLYRHEAAADRRHGLSRPGRAALAYAAILIAASAFVAGGALTPRGGGVAAAGAACAWLWAATARMRQRDLADRYIATGAEMQAAHSACVPLNAAAVRSEWAHIERLAVALSATDRGLPAPNVARASLLITDATSPLYSRGGDSLHRRLARTLFEIERGAEG